MTKSYTIERSVNGAVVQTQSITVTRRREADDFAKAMLLRLTKRRAEGSVVRVLRYNYDARQNQPIVAFTLRGSRVVRV